MKSSRFSLSSLFFQALLGGFVLVLAVPVAADSINFFVDFSTTDLTMGIMPGLFREGDGNLEDIIDKAELTSLMVNVAVQPNVLILTLSNADPAGYFSFNFPGDVMLKLGIRSAIPSAVMNFSGAFPSKLVNGISFGGNVLPIGSFN